MDRQGQRPKAPTGQSSGQTQNSYQEAPPPYSAFEVEDQERYDLDIPYAGKDLRRRSTDSLRPPGPEEQRERRKLVLIYIHGFQGNERSFRSFPAHVHNVVTNLLSDSHVVHSKIYPRYRSRKHITVARDDFSRWLAPHESDKTDVILFGHSMGGLLSAEVVLKLAEDGRSLQHKILGTINFDVPFLGMHPGVIKAGLSSLFVPSPEAPKEDAENGQIYLNSPSQSESSMSVGQSPGPSTSGQAQLSDPAQNQDPNFNPRFENDVILPMRKGWKNAWHFVNKHSDNLLKGTKQMVKSHVEFAGGMADYSSLRARYAKIRSLEVTQDAVRKSVVNERFMPPRSRFVNYYTASTGRPKPPKEEVKDDNTKRSSRETSPNNALDPATAGRGRSMEDNKSLKPRSGASSLTPSASASPRISLHEHTHDGVIEKDIEELNLDQSPTETRNDTPVTSPQDGSKTIGTTVSPSAEQRNAMEATVPTPRKQSPARPSITSRQSSVPSLASTDPATGPTSPDLSRYTSVTSSAPDDSKDKGPQKSRKDRKFCALPPKDSLGNRDPVWVRVFMKDVDEVAAHCGLFVESCPAYPSLVSDVAERVMEWVQDAESERVARELDAEYEY